MLLVINLAFKNLMGGRLRTVLNILILSFAFVAILLYQGLIAGMNDQMTRAVIEEEVGGGQFWVNSYDPYDPFKLDNAYGPLPSKLIAMVNEGQAEPILLRPATIFPQGREQGVVLRGINPNQNILKMPTTVLSSEIELPLIIGKRMAKSTGLKVGDTIMIRWRDKNGAFDAKKGTIVAVMGTIVQTIDRGQIWMSLQDLLEISNMEKEATILVLKYPHISESIEKWTYKSQKNLLQDVKSSVDAEKSFSIVMNIILLGLALIAIFDSQMFAVFRRRKEIGTLIALGMTRAKVIALFTIEGALNGVLAICAGFVWGLPLMRYMMNTGMSVYSAADDFGMAMPERLYASFSLQLILGSTLLIFLMVTIVSYLPTKKIAKLNPTDAIRGKVT
ncbi:MAG: FtsX-like permease family protein [Candidatus Margulisbacteria bacterium]|nr:FtsX-like permease family protein [Candidatus Margulisiibacteriota bacterium]